MVCKNNFRTIRKKLGKKMILSSESIDRCVYGRYNIELHQYLNCSFYAGARRYCTCLCEKMQQEIPAAWQTGMNSMFWSGARNIRGDGIYGA